MERQAEVVGSLNSPTLPLGTHPQRSGSSYPVRSGSCSAESSFLAQRDPGPKPHSWWGLSATEYRTSFLTALGSSSPAHRLVSQQPLPATNTLRQVCVCPQGPGPTLDPELQGKSIPQGGIAVPVQEGKGGEGRAQGEEPRED